MARSHVVGAVLAAALALTAPAPAAALTQMQRAVQSILKEYRIRNVDVTKLSIAQLAQIRFIADQPGREGGKRGQIQSVIGGEGSLRGLFRN